MANRIVNAYEQFLDDDGVPIADGTIEFTVNNDVNTQISVYTTIDLDTLQSNPYTLDDDGRVQGDVWIADNLLYTQVIKDSTGATVRTVHNNGEEAGEADQIISEGNNRFFNGGMGVAPNDSLALSTTKAETQVSGIYAKIAATGSGNADQGTNSLSQTGYVLDLNTLTLGSGDLEVYFDLKRQASFDLQEASLTVGFKVFHDKSPSVPVDIQLYAPTSTINDFSTLTQVATSGDISTAQNATTTVSYTFDISAAANKAKVANGLQIRLVFDASGMSSNQLLIGDFQAIKGNTLPTFVVRPDTEQEAASGYFRASDGAAATPTFGFRDNTGLYLNADDVIGVSFSGTELLQFDGSGSDMVINTSTAQDLVLQRNGTEWLGFDGSNVTAGGYPVVGLKSFQSTTSSIEVFIGGFTVSGSAIASELVKPSEWTYTYNSTGDYTVTHNFGDTGYLVLMTREFDGGTPEDLGNAQFENLANNTFDIRGRNVSAGNAEVSEVHFMVIRY